MISLLTTGFFILCSSESRSQGRCGTVEYQQQLREKNIITESQSEFEDWLNKKLINKKKTSGVLRAEEEVITIPVVVHIIHNGETLGSGLNIPDDQIFSQIDVLNEDFRRENDDKSKTPALFVPVAADIEINFALAQRDPEGLATNGIVRVNGGKSVWEIADNYELKSLSYWPAEDYLNIWVTNLGSDYLGYAQFPVSTLEGLEDGSNSRLSDGVAIDSEAFGSSVKYPPAVLKTDYDRGRTATHEIGHYLGLRHIWGDGNCNVDDYCNDTPLAQTDNAGLSLCNFPGPNSCSNDSPDLPDMFQNYMDYTDDVCMNLFTLDQKSRIRVVMDNSPRRASLKTSLGNQPPVTVSNDLGIRNVLSPTYSVCGGSFIPTLEMRNYGTNSITSYSIRTNIDNSEVSVTNLTTSLNNLDIEIIDLPEISLSGLNADTIVLSFEIITINGGTDENDQNNLEEFDLIIPEKSLGVLKANFSQFPLGWQINNVDGLTTWEVVDAINDEIDNKALWVDFYNYDNEGAIDLFSSPVMDLSDFPTAQLSFDVAYAKYPGIDNEALLVIIGKNCADPVNNGDTVYYKLADQLRTTSNTSGEFSPASGADWRRETIDLADYVGLDNIQITFIAKNAYGNNLYIDNISVDQVENKIISPSPATCLDGQPLIIEVVNNETTPINSVDIMYSIDNGSAINKTFNFSSPVNPGFSTTITENIAAQGNGGHTIEVEISLPNTTESRFLSYSYYVDQVSDSIPVKENVDDISRSDWIVVNHDNDLTWESGTSQGRNFIFVQNATYASIGEEDWFISPILDFTSATNATLTFDVAYSGINLSEDRLTILLSTDCGENFDVVLYNKDGANLSTGEFNGNPTPANWVTETIDLSEFLPYTDVRIAFMATNRNGNNIYLDEIEIYSTEYLADEAGNILFPNPAIDGEFRLQFDLDNKENVSVIIVNRNGQEVFSVDLPGTLNQQYSFTIANEPAGLYLVRIIGESFSSTKKVVKPN